MAIPDFQTLMLPLLKLASDNNEHKLRDSIEALATEYNLTPEERQQLLPSGSQAIFDNRVGWTKTHLIKAGLLQSPRRSIFKITEKGKNVLQQNPEKINMSFLKQFPDYLEFIKPTTETEKDDIHESTEDTSTPEETLENSYQKIRRNLAGDLLLKVKKSSPAFFERMVVELLVKMGYGGSLKDAGRATKLTNDEGIDGIIKEDRLGLDTIFIQAKRWQGSVGRPEIQKFVGALQGQRARKGVFITTSFYTADAIDYASRIDTKVVLIDGKQLSALMIDFDVGVSAAASYVVKRIDSDYFEEN